MKDSQNPDQSPYDNLSDAAATYAVGGISNHWTAAVARQHPAVERSSIIDYEEWQVLYKESEKHLKKSDDLFQNSIGNTIVKEVLNETYKDEITESECLPQNLPLAGVRKKKEFVMWSGSVTILGENLVKDIKSGDCWKIQLKVGECILVTRGGGGGTQQIFMRGGSAPRSNPLPFYIPFLTEKVPYFVQMIPVTKADTS